MYNMVYIINNTVLYIWNLLREYNIIVLTKNKKKEWGDGCINELDGESFYNAYIY